MQTPQADYFAAYRNLKLSRDDKGVLVAEFPQFNLSVDSRLPERKPEQFQGRMAVMIG
jgi:hypothetical protein